MLTNAGMLHHFALLDKLQTLTEGSVHLWVTFGTGANMRYLAAHDPFCVVRVNFNFTSGSRRPAFLIKANFFLCFEYFQS